MMNAGHKPEFLTQAAAFVASAGALCAALTGCRGTREDEPPRQFLPDMDDSPKFKPQTPSDFFEDGRAMRPSVPGTVPFGSSADGASVLRAAYLKESTETWTGVDPARGLDKDGKVQYVRLMPPEVLDLYIARSGDRSITYPTRDAAFRSMLTRGQERFNIYCSVCHGFSAEGGNPAAFSGGQAGRRWSYPVPSLHEPKYTDRESPTGADGYIFNVIQNGVPEVDPTKPNKMPAYGDKINEADAWAVVAYLRVIQASWQEKLENLPPDLRQKYEQSRPPLPAPAATPPKQTSMLETKP